MLNLVLGEYDVMFMDCCSCDCGNVDNWWGWGLWLEDVCVCDWMVMDVWLGRWGICCDVGLFVFVRCWYCDMGWGVWSGFYRSLFWLCVSICMIVNWVWVLGFGSYLGSWYWNCVDWIVLLLIDGE